MGNLLSYFNNSMYYIYPTNINSYYIEYFKKKYPYVIQIYYDLMNKKGETIIKLDKKIIEISKDENINGKLVKFEHVFDKPIQISQHTYYFDNHNEIENFILKINELKSVNFSFLKNQDSEYIYINKDLKINNHIKEEATCLGKLDVSDFDLVYSITLKN